MTNSVCVQAYFFTGEPSFRSPATCSVIPLLVRAHSNEHDVDTPTGHDPPPRTLPNVRDPAVLGVADARGFQDVNVSIPALPT